MKTSSSNFALGILGGMGPQATHYFTGEILKAFEEFRCPSHDQDYPDIVVRYACYLPDRTTSIQNDLLSFSRPFKRELQILKDLGCRKIVVPCISAHAAI